MQDDYGTRHSGTLSETSAPFSSKVGSSHSAKADVTDPDADQGCLDRPGREWIRKPEDRRPDYPGSLKRPQPVLGLSDPSPL